MTAQRGYDYLNFIVLGNFMFLGFNALAMFLIGIYFSRRGPFRDIESNRHLFRRLLALGLVIGLTGNLIYVALGMPLSRAEPSFVVFGFRCARLSARSR